MSTDKHELKTRVIEEIDRLADKLIGISETIHRNPEIAFQEFQASTLLTSTAKAHGFAIRRGIAGLETAFVARYPEERSGTLIAFLAEYDALPDLGHACGHNIIGTASLGAALAVRSLLDDLPGQVQLIGTPAEEKGGGKVIMVDAGVFEGVDLAIMTHPSSRNLVDRRSLASNNIVFEFHGQAAHAAAAPDCGVNALDAVILTFNNINALRQHLRDDARVHGIVTHGGSAHNIVPDYAAARFSVRAADKAYSLEVLDKVINCAKAAALATGATVEIKRLYSYDNMIPNSILAECFRQNLEALGIEAQNAADNERMGSTDMGNVSQVVPSLHPYVAIAPEGTGGHTPEFRDAAISEAGHRGLIVAAKAMAMTAVDFLVDDSLMAQARTEFEESRGVRNEK